MSKSNMHPIFAAICAPFTPEEISRESLVQAMAEIGDEDDKCACRQPMLSGGSSICDFCGKWNEEAEAAKAANGEPHQHGCICADCSGAELTSEND